MLETSYCFSQFSPKNIKINQSFCLNKLIIIVKYLMCSVPSLIVKLQSENHFSFFPHSNVMPCVFLCSSLFPPNNVFIPLHLLSLLSLSLKFNYILDNRYILDNFCSSGCFFFLFVFAFSHHFASSYLICERSWNSLFSEGSCLIHLLSSRWDFIHLFTHSFDKCRLRITRHGGYSDAQNRHGPSSLRGGETSV